MGKYGNAAVMAVELYRNGLASSPNNAWAIAVTKVFPSCRSSQEKACPRGAFLGLCESGVVFGITEGSYSRSIKNKWYALKALDLLTQEPDLALDEKTLWHRVTKGEKKTANNQMDVVISIWNAGLTRT